MSVNIIDHNIPAVETMKRGKNNITSSQGDSGFKNLAGQIIILESDSQSNQSAEVDESKEYTVKHVVPDITFPRTKPQSTGNKPKSRAFRCDLCNKIFAGRGSLSNHMITHTGERQFKCDHCQKAFTRKDHLQCHIRIHTGQKPFKCSVCGKTFATASHMKVHMRNHTGERPYKCNLCSKHFICSSGLKNHMFAHTGQKPHKCAICKRHFGAPYLLQIHMKRSHGLGDDAPASQVRSAVMETRSLKQLLSCHDKQSSTRSIKLTANDITDNMPPPLTPLKAVLADFMASGINGQKCHEAKSESETPFDKQFPSVAQAVKKESGLWNPSVDKDSLDKQHPSEDHIKNIHQSTLDFKPRSLELQISEEYSKLQPSHQCTECKDHFDSKNDLDCHRWICLKSVTDRMAENIKTNKLRPLLRINSKPDNDKNIMPKSVILPHDDKDTAYRPLNFSHGGPMRSISTRLKSSCEVRETTVDSNVVGSDLHVKVWTCNDCKKTFHCPSKLKIHKMVHSEARPYTCTVCKISFKGRGSLHNHMIGHSGVRPFQCSHCGRTFTRKEHLVIHTRLHTGDKPFSCDVCEKKFATASHKKVHMRIHSGERPFPCDMCKICFMTSALLKTHKKKHHSGS